MNPVDWFHARTRRERMLIVVAAGLSLFAALWLAAGQARDYRRAAEQDARLAQADLATAKRVLSAPRPQGDVASRVQAAASAHGVVIEIAQVDGGLDLSIASTSSVALFGFLSDLDAEGLAPSSFTIVENADATLQMQGRI